MIKLNFADDSILSALLPVIIHSPDRLTLIFDPNVSPATDPVCVMEPEYKLMNHLVTPTMSPCFMM